jgi:hypothetical protein
LTQDQLARLQGPLTTPITPPRPSGPPPSPIWVDNNRPNPGYVAAPSGPTTLVTPAAPQPTAADLIIESHSKDLAENLRLAGVVRPADSAAHHIASWDHPDAARARAILDRFDVGIDSADNGVYLPNTRESGAPGSYHPRLHNSDYYEAIDAALDRATSRVDVMDILDQIRQQLLNGTFPGTRARPIENPGSGAKP